MPDKGPRERLGLAVTRLAGCDCGGKKADDSSDSDQFLQLIPSRVFLIILLRPSVSVCYASLLLNAGFSVLASNQNFKSSTLKAL